VLAEEWFLHGILDRMRPSPSALLAEARKLSPGDRLELIAELWDTLESSDLLVTDEERAILESRMADLEANPSAQESWQQVRASLESRRR
jgi:putative addiction module component (TIGR02574 family)